MKCFILISSQLVYMYFVWNRIKVKMLWFTLWTKHFYVYVILNCLFNTYSRLITIDYSDVCFIIFSVRNPKSLRAL